MAATDQDVVRRSRVHRPIHVVEIDALRKSDNATVTLRYCDAVWDYRVTGLTAQGLIAPDGISDLVYSVKADGGLSPVTSWSVKLVNPAGGSSYLSALQNTYDIEARPARLRMAFRTGVETEADFVTLFSGRVYEDVARDDVWELTCRSTSTRDIPAVPDEKLELLDYLNAPEENWGRLIPVVFGDLATSDTGRVDFADAALLRPMQVDSLQRVYHGGLRSKTYGSVFLALPDDRDYYQIAGGTQSGALWTAPGADVTIAQGPIKQYTHQPAGGERIEGGSRPYDGDRSTYWQIDGRNGFHLELGPTVRLPNLSAQAQSGTVSWVRVYIRVGYDAPSIGTGGSTGLMGTTVVTQGLRGRIFSTGQSLGDQYVRYANLTAFDNPFGSNRNRNDYRPADFYMQVDADDVGISDDHWSAWNFSSRFVEFDLSGQTNSPFISYYGDFRVYEVWIVVGYQEASVASLTPTNVFQSIGGYEDQASHYRDGGVVNTAGATIRHPADILQVLLRDDLFGGNRPVADLDVDSFENVRALDRNLRFDFAVRQQMNTSNFSDFLFQAGMRLQQSRDGRFRLSAVDRTSRPVAYFGADEDIDLETDGASTFSHQTTPVGGVKNSFFLRYGWNAALDAYTKAMIRSPAYTTTGTCVITGSGATRTVTDGSATFRSDGVQVGYRFSLDAARTYEVASIPSESSLTIRQAAGGPAPANAGSATYFVGPGFDYRCYESSIRFAGTFPLRGQGRPIESRLIQDDYTARIFIERLVDYYTDTRSLVNFFTGYRATIVQAGDTILVDHPLMPADERPSKVGELSRAITVRTRIIDLRSVTRTPANDTSLLLRGGGREEVLYKTSTRSGTSWGVDRAQADTTSPAWPVGTDVLAFPFGFQATDVRYLPRFGDVELTAETI